MSATGGEADTRLFVGRAVELDELRCFAAEAWGGNPRLVMIEGDAGVGKSSLLRRAVAELGGCHVLRASGDEAELMVPYGVVDQLVDSAGVAATDGLDLLLRLRDASDTAVAPSAVGAELVRLFGNLQANDRPVVVVVDDLHWCDSPSAQALLFASRRLQRDRVLVLVSARQTELVRLGGSWASTVGGDHRTGRIRLDGFTADDIVALATSLGMGPLTSAAAEPCWRNSTATCSTECRPSFRRPVRSRLSCSCGWPPCRSRRGGS
jgi:type II secretory pathway predicted ATPase ExeA